MVSLRTPWSELRQHASLAVCALCSVLTVRRSCGSSCGCHAAARDFVRQLLRDVLDASDLGLGSRQAEGGRWQLLAREAVSVMSAPIEGAHAARVDARTRPSGRPGSARARCGGGWRCRGAYSTVVPVASVVGARWSVLRSEAS